MIYYILKFALDSKIVGKYPQVEKAKHHCHVYNDDRFIDKFLFKKIEIDPITSDAILESQAKPTDLISAGIIGFHRKLLISNRLKELILKFRKNGLQFFNSNVIHRSTVINDYWVMNMYDDDMNCLNFEKSIIVSGINMFDDLEQLSIETFKQFQIKTSRIEEMGYPNRWSLKRFMISTDCSKEFLMIYRSFQNPLFVVSETFKKEVEKYEFTGMEFMPTHLKLNEWLNEERVKAYGLN